MAYEQREMSGSLWSNKNKKSDNSPALTGTVKIHGVLYSIFGWIKYTQNNTKWISLSVKEPEDQRTEPPEQPPQREPQERQDEFAF